MGLAELLPLSCRGMYHFPGDTGVILIRCYQFIYVTGLINPISENWEVDA